MITKLKYILNMPKNKYTIFLFFLLLGLNNISKAQIFSDSVILDMSRAVKELKNQNENLRNRIENQSKSINDLSKNQMLSDQAKWELIKGNLSKAVVIYQKLSDAILDLKSQVINQDFQGYVKELSSVEKNPLGFSFDQMIIKIAESKSIFKKKKKNEKFVNTLKALSTSPIVSLIPYASQAVSLSSAAINVAYSAGFQDKKVPLENVQAFEKDLKRYIGYYAALDKANLLNQNSSTQAIAGLENLQFELLDKLKKDLIKIGLNPREQRADETLDDYFNFLTRELNEFFIRNLITNIEQKYKKTDGKLNVVELLNNELDIRHVNNNLDQMEQISSKFVNIYDQYFDAESKYIEQLKGAINIAKANGIIEGIGEKTAEMVYQDLMKKLGEKMKKKDAAIKSSINIKELKYLIESMNIYKIL